ncbi:VOC family protein [uncultured Roseobacter sp.]|uniref:VOC family protein n=1 Tax=uncultured Roseobacter sp. TaxID=114847 RepID=UPI002617D389|nr:VOC family protein [uncultured Roseobacter sp.]
MNIGRLDHVNLRTNRLDQMVAWYSNVLGLVPGERPDFGFRGAWLYVGSHPMVHLVEVPAECAATDPKIEHFAFTAQGYKGFVARLRDNNVAFDAVRIPGLPIVQVNVADVDGNHIHVDFNAGEADLKDEM